MLRACIVGCGNISGNHINSLKKMSGVEISAVCDVIPERADKAAKETGAKAYYSFEDALADKSIDVYHICTPHYLHKQQSVAALLSGRNVFSEKPLCLNEKEGLEIEAALQKSGKKMGVCFQNRFLKTSALAKKIIDSKEFGEILGARGFVLWSRDKSYYEADAWRGKWATEGGGVLINQAIHTLDLLVWLCGGYKSAEGHIATYTLKDAIEVEDTAMINIALQNGKNALFFATNSYCVNEPIEIQVVMEKAVLNLKNELTVFDRQTGEIITKDSVERLSGEKSYWGSGHEIIIREFYASLESGKDFSPSVSEALNITKLLDNVYNG